MHIKYRPEIDGLRTIAVLAVLIYHAQITLGDGHFLKGGFLGVDVFFVISGFLITSIIIKELHVEGRFSFLGFYERRARRILPALFLVILTTLPFAWYLLLPTQLIDFAKSIISTLLFGSNFYWFDSSQQYGAESALLKPFLHTWSLAVEEQYYIVFPFILFAIYRWFKSYTVVLLTAALIVSLMFSDYATSRHQPISFYMLPTRFWELLAGSLLANIIYFHPHSEKAFRFSNLMPGIGLLLVGYALFFIDYERNHPGYVTLIPVIGTVLIIWFASEKELITRLLSTKLFVAIGLVSYSLYLWHYPIFAFGRIIDPAPDWFDKTIWLLLTFILSILGYYLIEKPFRDRNKTTVKAFAIAMLTSVAIILAVTLFFIFDEKPTPTTERLQLIYGSNEIDNQRLRRSSWDVLEKIHNDLGYNSKREAEADDASLSEREKLWFTSETETKKVLILGNSHSKDLFNALKLNEERFPNFEFARYGIHITSSNERFERLLASPNFKAADLIFVSPRFGTATVPYRPNHKTVKKLPEFIQRLQAHGKTVVLTSNTQEFLEYRGYENIFDGYIREKQSAFDVAELGEVYYQNRDLEVIALNEALKNIAMEAKIAFLDKTPIICDEQAKQCDGATDNGLKTFYDYGHFTLEGAKYFGRKMADQGWLDELK